MPSLARWLPSLTLLLPAVQGCRANPSALLPTAGMTPSAILAPASTIPFPGERPAYWIPAPGTTWQWQLTGLPVDLAVEAEVYDLDLFETDPETIAALHSQGKRVICYLSAGSWEEWRPDATLYPEGVIGDEYVGWPGERWVDVRQLEELAPLLTSRLQLCREKGFDAVEPDNIDGYANDTGFPIAYEDQLRFNLWLAGKAHSLGLSIGLKNDAEQIPDLVSEYDWALAEDCYDQGWCDALSPFLLAGKAVFAAEYTDGGADFARACQTLEPAGFSLILKDRDLSAWREVCHEAPGG